tara:strand:- start:985 stop:1575 length:591 start_codon:yes stop_codon:yes gene_type:complete
MAVSSNVKDFLSKVKSGVKPNLFRVKLDWPSGLGVTQSDRELGSFLCKAAALPASNLGVIDVPFRGRVVKVAGDRTFDTWSVTIINDTNFRLRNLFEGWLQKINAHEENIAELVNPDSAADGYTKDLVVHQLGRSGEEKADNYVKSYKLWGCFPTQVSQIDLAYDSNDQIEEFTVEFQVQYWTAGSNSEKYDNGIS